MCYVNLFSASLVLCEMAPAVGTEGHRREGRGSHTSVNSMGSPGAAGRLKRRNNRCIVVRT